MGHIVFGESKTEILLMQPTVKSTHFLKKMIFKKNNLKIEYSKKKLRLLEKSSVNYLIESHSE
jgi:hypothetical protein